MRAPQRVEKTGWHVVLADDDYAIVIERALKKAAGVPVEMRRACTGSEALEEIKRDDRIRSIPVAIRRGATGASSTAVSAVDRQSMAAVKVLRWVAVVGVLIALYFYGRVTGAF